MSDISQQTVEMTKKWTETQSQLLDNWFEAVKKSDPAAIAKNMNPEEMQKAMQTWQDATRKMMESQMEMIRTWTAPRTPPK
jgi:biopolymer transport protein ExbB/TolQ